MRHLPLYLLLTTVAGCTLPALVSSETVSDDAPATVATATAAEVKAVTTGRTGLTADRGHKVFIESLASLKLTTAAQASLTSSGFELVDTRERVDVMYELGGVFQALHPATRCAAEVRVGDYAENPVPLATGSGRGGSVILSLNPLAMPIGIITSSVGNVTGAQDLVNAITTGDPDGKCLSHYGTWRYRQHNVINLTHKEGSTEQKCSMLTTAGGAELVSARLIQSSLAGLQEAAGLTMALGLPANPALAR